MIEFEVKIVEDALELLEKKVSILNEVQAALEDDDDEVLDDIKDDIDSFMSSKGVDEEKIDAVLEEFDDADIETIMKCVSIDKSDIYVDWDETQDLDDSSMIAFSVPCKFNLNKFRKLTAA